MSPQYLLDSYEHSLAIEVRFAKDIENLEYNPPYKWYLGRGDSGFGSYSEKIFPDPDDPLCYGRYMQVRILFQTMDLERPLPMIDSLEVETYRVENAPAVS